jgi:hypothetical protein
MGLGGQFLLTRALRYRYLARKARQFASTFSTDEIAPRMMELANKFERDAMRDEELGRTLQMEEAADSAALAMSSD